MVWEEIMPAAKKMKGGKGAGMEGIVVVMAKRKVLTGSNKCMECGVVPEDWKAPCTVPITKRMCQL